MITKRYAWIYSVDLDEPNFSLDYMLEHNELVIYLKRARLDSGWSHAAFLIYVLTTSGRSDWVFDYTVTCVT